MLVWLIKDGEVLPIDDATRPMRTGMLAKALVERGHEILWWSSTFSHQQHRLREAEGDVILSARFSLRLLNAGTYRRNLSWQRYRHDEVFSRRFREEAGRYPPPDVIVCCLPINSVAEQAIEYALPKGIPVVIDIRDLWPDVWLERTPAIARPVVRVMLGRKYRRTKSLLRRASSIVAVSNHYLQWGASLGERGAQERDAVFYIGYSASDPPETPSERIRDLRERLLGQLVVVFVGSFSDSFNLELILDAARVFQNSTSKNVHFVLAGDGGQFREIASKAAALSNVTVTGWLSGGEARALLAVSDVALAPYRLVHTVPNKLFEYMAAGLPIVSSLRGEAEELLEEGGVGLTYEVDDMSGFCDQLSLLIGDPDLRRQKGIRALEMYRARFTADAIYRSYAEHVERVARTTNA